MQEAVINRLIAMSNEVSRARLESKIDATLEITEEGAFLTLKKTHRGEIVSAKHIISWVDISESRICPSRIVRRKASHFLCDLALTSAF